MERVKEKVLNFLQILKDVKLENLFLIFFVPIGIAYAFTMLLLHVPDELAHIRRSYNISNFQIIEHKNEERTSNY